MLAFLARRHFSSYIYARASLLPLIRLPQAQSRSLTMSSSARREKNRTDLLNPTTDPYPKVEALGTGPLYGPTRDEHVVLILGVGPGLGLALAHTFAAQGYATAIMSRSKDRLDAWAAELDKIARNARGAQEDNKEQKPLSLAFACDVLDNASIERAINQAAAAWPDKKIGTAIYNASIRKKKPFLELPMKSMEDSVQASIFGGFTFMQTVIKSMKERNGAQGGNVLVTGATSSIRGRESFAAFAASKGGLRQMCQSVAREYGPEGIHIAHVVVDGLIESDESKRFFGFQEGQRFRDGTTLRPEEIAKNYLFLALQSPSTWTFELDLRPAKEHF